MAKKSLIERELKKKNLVYKYSKKKKNLKKSLKLANKKDIIFKLMNQLQKLPKKSYFTKLRNRCLFTGRARGNYKEYNISRFIFRTLSLNGILPGIIKASW